MAQDLKALSILLNSKAVPFVIDLAVMASRREYLNLDKWLGDQIREHGERFIKAIVQYLHRRLPVLADPSQGPLKEKHFAGKSAMLPPETLPVMIVCLQQAAQQIALHPEVKEAIVTMMSQAQPFLTRPRQQPPPVQQQQPPPGQLRPAGVPGPPPLPGQPPPPPVVTGASGFPPVSLPGGPVRPTPRQALPPGAMAAAALAGGMFPPTADPLVSQFGNLGLGGVGATPTSAAAASSTSSSAFSMPSGLGPLVSGGGAASPNRFPSGPGGAVIPPTSIDGGSPSPFSGMLPPPGVSAPGLPGLPPAAPGLPGLPTSSQAPMPPPPGVSAATTSAGGSGPGIQSGIEQIRQGNISQIFPEMAGPISREVEDEANRYFQQIYNQPPNPTLTIDEVLELLKKFQDSAVQREREVFSCMIKNLFEEYKYFPQYPEKELHVTAQLFGGIIEHGLVTMVPLGLALRFVLDAVKRPTDSNMYFFGVAALDRFRSRLKDYPQYCQHITCIEHFKEFPAHLVEWVEFGQQSAMPPSKPHGPVLPPQLEALIKGQAGQPGALGATVVTLPSARSSVGIVGPKQPVTSAPAASTAIGAFALSQAAAAVTSSAAATATTQSAANAIVRPTPIAVGGRPSIANTTNIDTLLNARIKVKPDDEVKLPGEKIQEKVAFIFNNLSQMNMQQKADELMDKLPVEFTPWLAQYLVMKRASIEPNFHTLYSNFLEVVKRGGFYGLVLEETFGSIRVLLGSDKSIANFSDRSLLKNLGHWLGLMTLGRNRPILMRELDFKPLIIEAFHNGQQELMYVVPFIAKVVESCAKSRVFKHPNPWTTGILNLLAELHQEQDLKLNLKFEIEVLCKALGLELTSLTPGTLLKDFDKINKILKMPSMAPMANVGQQKPDNMPIVGIPPVAQSTPIGGGPVDPSSIGGSVSLVGGGGLGFPTGFATGSGGPTSSSSLPPSMMAPHQGSGFANPVRVHLIVEEKTDLFDHNSDWPDWS